jgi:hypothetical protein
MILFVPALLIALAVLLWITWLAIGPRSVTIEPKRFLFDARKDATEGESGGFSNPPRSTSDEYQEHVRTRLDAPHLPLSSLSGGPGATHSMLASRESFRAGERRAIDS